MVNRLHGTGLPRVVVKLISAVLHAWHGLFTLGLLWLVWQSWGDADRSAGVLRPWIFAYLCICALFAAFHFPRWLWHRLRQATSGTLAAHNVQVIDLAERTGEPLIAGYRAWACSFVPGNQLLRLHVEEKTLRIPDLAPELAGLSIAHITDLHFTGRVTRAYFDRAVDLVNELDADLVAVTGDVCDKTACEAWIQPTLGRLKSRLGTFFVLGNHDLLVDDVDALRLELANANLVDVSQRPQRVSLRGQDIVLCGNELPWIRRSCDPPTESASDSRHPLRILLAHSPDQFDWARARKFDLVLAGHTHGGQIRLPGIGAVVCPSLYGVDYAGGVFTGGGAVMHASRGTCSVFPLRLFCPPEITKIVLAPGR